MMLLLLATLALHPPVDSLARYVAVAPAESLRVTAVGPADGPSVVIIPGLISPAYAFRKVLPSLADSGIRAIVVEPLGVGMSSHPGNADYSHTAQAARIAAVLDTMHVSHAVIMGHSVGTAMALRLALARPDLVKSLLLIEGGALEEAAVPGVKQALKFAFLIKLFAGRGRVRSEVKKGLMKSSGDTTWVTDSLVDRYTEGVAGDLGAVLRALKGMQKAEEPDSLRPQLKDIQVPVHLLLGGAAHSGGPSPGRVRTMEHRLPNFSMETVYGAGLHIHEEQPEPVIHDLVRMVRQTEP